MAINVHTYITCIHTYIHIRLYVLAEDERIKHDEKVIKSLLENDKKVFHTYIVVQKLSQIYMYVCMYVITSGTAQ